MSGATAAVVEIATKALCTADDGVRDARRLLFTGGREASEEAVAESTVLIDQAISQLVKARAALNGTEAVEAL